jgi:hypothetical protein
LPLRGVSHILLLSENTWNIRARFMEWKCADTNCTQHVWASSKYELFRDYFKKRYREDGHWLCYVENLVILKVESNGDIERYTIKRGGCTVFNFTERTGERAENRVAILWPYTLGLGWKDHIFVDCTGREM